ncbi:hypothetical protein E3N88_34409 [Mikania micrantha]|uniref:Endoplasmic reticulum transmembrane protein n=1 Tax=Mikania micrantha TaxID=192012 RepID=A0A5N6LY18_9ASTR|nr:hypothetical protein E3N88_34409 [Mikania micrantha]
MEAAKKQNRAAEENKNKGADEVKLLNDELSKLKTQIVKLESEHEAKEKEIKSAEANSLALKNQSEGFLLEYDRLLAENQDLRDQLRAIDESASHSSGKKNMVLSQNRTLLCIPSLACTCKDGRLSEVRTTVAAKGLMAWPLAECLVPNGDRMDDSGE